jgi:uncharacterized protein (TIGR02246 family)
MTMTPQEIADRYFAAMTSQDLEALLALFTEDGVIVWPDGRAIEGKPAIREIYARLFQSPANNPVPAALMIGPESFSVAVASSFDSGETRRTLNVFRLGADGLIARMDSYKQG